MSFKYDAFGNKLKEKSNRRDHNMRTHAYHENFHDQTESTQKRQFDNVKLAEPSSEDIDHSYVKDEQAPVAPNCLGHHYTQLTLRICVILVAFAGMLVASLSPLILPSENIECIKDQLFIQTQPINEYFREHTNIRNAFMIFCGLFMDITVIFGFVLFAATGRTWRLILSLTLFYGLRFIIQKTFLMRFPDGFQWGYPGFPSLVVPYGYTNDFFYSGHVGGALTLALEYRMLAKEYFAEGKHGRVQLMRFMQFFSILTIVLQVMLMTFLQGHYSIDMITGLIVAHYFYMLSTTWAPKIDLLVCNLHKKQRKGHQKVQEEERSSWGEKTGALSNDRLN